LGGTQRGVEDAAEAVELTSQQWWEGEGEHQHRRPRAEVRGARDLTLLAGLLELLGCRLLCLLAAGVLAHRPPPLMRRPPGSRLLGWPGRPGGASPRGAPAGSGRAASGSGRS